jgi:LPXTG-site transpeptidase (sortase) family protein
MYRRRSFNPLTLIILGTLAGIAFLIYDNILTPEPSTISPTAVAIVSSTPEPTVVEQATAHADRGIVSEATIFIPSAGVLAPIIEVFLDGESWDVSKLGNNVGHLQGTSWLDASGNVVLSGHVELTSGGRGVFASLEELKTGESIIVTYQGVERRYSVTELKRVEPDDLTPVFPTSDDRLTLITCDEYNFLQNTYLQRVVVVAERID